MPLIELETSIRAPIETVFDLARSIDTHKTSAVNTEERAIAGRTSGLIELGETVTFEARHFGVRQRLTVKITAFDRPHCFEDEMVHGVFASMHHCHEFRAQDDSTLMIDRFAFRAPLGPLGRVAERLFLTSYLTRFLERRNAILKSLAESTV